MGYNNIVLVELIAEIWECGHITKKKSDEAKTQLYGLKTNLQVSQTYSEETNTDRR